MDHAAIASCWDVNMGFKAKNIFEGAAKMIEADARKPKKKKPMKDDSAMDGKSEPDEDDMPMKGKKSNLFKKK